MIMRIATTLAAILVTFLLAACVQVVRNSGTQTMSQAAADAVRVATYNVHYIIARRETGAWSVGDWERRKGPMDSAFKEINADIIGFQEMESFARGVSDQENLTLTWLLANNPDYAAAAVGDPKVFPSTQPILYRKDRFVVLDQGWYFFSDTPDIIYSRTFNGSFPAFASWAQFQDISTGRTFRVVNLHTDFKSRTNRLQSLELVAMRTRDWIEAGDRVFVIGDFNARQGAQTLRIAENVGVTFPRVKGSTYHLNRGLNLFGAIDHIGYAGPVTPIDDPVVLRQKFDGEWPTDHYPVILDFALTP